VAVIRRRRRCADCRAELGAGNNSGRCTDCLELLEAERDELSDSYAPRAAAESTRTVIREGGSGRSLPPRIIATQGDAEREPARRPARQVPQHDHATRVAMKYAERANEMSSWDEIAGTPQGGDTIDFHPAHEAPLPAADGWGRSHRPRAARAEYVLYNPAALGAAFALSTAAGDRAVHAQKHAQQGAGRFGPGIDVGRIHAGQLASPPSTMVSAENRAAEQAQAQRQAMAEHARLLLPGR
jgi:hypothetical protein